MNDRTSPEDFLSDEIVTAAARERSRIRDLSRQLAAGQTLVSVAIDLAERNADVIITTEAAGRYLGRIFSVGEDVISMMDDRNRLVLLPTAHLCSIRTLGRIPPSNETRNARTTEQLSTNLLALAEDRADVAIDMCSGARQPSNGTTAVQVGNVSSADSIIGTLIRANEHIAVITDRSTEAGHCYIATPKITAVTVLSH